ncbi:MAG: hypothetical protein JO173_00495 [Gammaproteobacteria bacterium]|nr:hypothetical protein [Gammaproteobacteria bacterium]
MRKLIRVSWVPAALVLAACDVQVRDTTPAEFPANHDIGMYEVSATVTRDAMVSSGSVFMFAFSGNQKVTLSSSGDGSEWHGLVSVRCQNSFPVQFLVEWQRAALPPKHKLEPPQPQMVKLIEPPLTRSASFDSSGKEPKGGWTGTVQYRFVTMPSVQITGARIEPASGDAADVAAAKPISVVTPMPVVAGCGDLAEIKLASTSAHARGMLVIDTDHPQDPHWQTGVEFSPK